MPNSRFAGLLGLMLIAQAQAADYAWYPFPVETGPLAVKNRPQQDYVPLTKAKRPWQICVSFPHLKDEYWLAVDYGVTDESRRLDLRLRLYEAGGYEDLELQRQQLLDCVSQGAEAVVIGAISYRGLNDLVARFRQQGLPVIDLVNGMESSEASARSLVSFRRMGEVTGEYLVERHRDAKQPVDIAWFPGPEKAGWVEAGDAGFRAALNGTALRIVDTRYGDTGIADQTRLIEATLKAHPQVKYLVGTAVTAEAATRVLRSRGLVGKIQVLAYYFNPGVYAGIRQGQILAAPSDAPVIQGRIAIDQAVRLLEGKPVLAIASPKIRMLDKTGLENFDRLTSLAPRGFRVTFSVN